MVQSCTNLQRERGRDRERDRKTEREQRSVMSLSVSYTNMLVNSCFLKSEKGMLKRWYRTFVSSAISFSCSPSRNAEADALSWASPMLMTHCDRAGSSIV